MTINPLSNIQPNYFDSLINNTNSASSATSNSSWATLPQDCSPQLSPAASFLSQLQQLQQQDPSQFQQLTTSITSQLRQAAQTATTNGNSTEATQLNNLADQFQSASNGGTVPTLQGSGVSGHHHHHHGGGGAAGQYGSQATSNSQSLLENMISPSSASSLTSTSTGSGTTAA